MFKKIEKSVLWDELLYLAVPPKLVEARRVCLPIRLYAVLIFYRCVIQKDPSLKGTSLNPRCHPTCLTTIFDRCIGRTRHNSSLAAPRRNIADCALPHTNRQLSEALIRMFPDPRVISFCYDVSIKYPFKKVNSLFEEDKSYVKCL